MARVEGALEQLSKRLDGMEMRLNHVETEIGELRREMRSNFRWTLRIMLGVLIPMWVSIILTILFHVP